jgi:DNA-binding CsgD family transcriptional regulator
MNQKVAIRARDEIVRLSGSGLNTTSFRRAVIASLRRALPIDAIWFATTDPATLLFTGSFVEAIPESLTPAFVTNEFLEDDVNKWVSLARHNRANSLFRATKNRPQESSRFRNILAPVGFGDELRAALLDGQSCWGYMCLHRERDDEGFRADEIDFLQSVVKYIARGLRDAILVENVAAPETADSPGMLVLADDLSLVSTSRPAEQWLSEIHDLPGRRELPQAIYGLARRLQEIEALEDPIPSPRVRIRTHSGRWLVGHAMRLHGAEAETRIGIVLEPAARSEVLPLALLAYGLTQREAEVTQLVLRGSSTAEIAQILCISALTVQQHLKGVFNKTGVSSRRELSAKVLYEQYVPVMASGATPGLSGGFLSRIE